MLTKIKDWIKNHKLITIVISLGIITLGLALIFGKKKQEVLAPTPAPIKFELLRTYPHGGVQETAFPTTAIQFAFSKPLDKAKTRAEIFPTEAIELVFQNEDKDVYVKPKPFWVIGKEYKIKLYPRSKDGEAMGPLDFSFQFVSPTNSDLEEAPNQL